MFTATTNSHRRLLSLLTFTLPSLISAASSSLSAPPVGCGKLGCPVQGSNYKCVVGNESYTIVGASALQQQKGGSISSDLALVKAVNTIPGLGQGNTRPFDSVFYLGYPPSFGSSNSIGCFVFFDPPRDHFYKGSNGRQTQTTGTCTDVISHQCVDQLLNLVSHTATDHCSAVTSALRHYPPAACKNLTGSSGLSYFSAVPLDKPKAIVGKLNASSTCWPVLPKSDSLAVITRHEQTGDYSVNDIMNIAFNITPVLSVVTDKSKNHTTAGLTCLKAIGDDPMGNADNGSSGGGDGGGSGKHHGAASDVYSVNWVLFSLTMIVVSFFVL